MKLFGLSGNREVFRKITSHPQQVIGCELFRSLDGDMLDQRVLRVRNGELELEILVDRGFDIGRVTYRGIPTQWLSPAGFRHAHSFSPTSMEPDGWGWLRSWQGGFLSTIGVDHVGGPVTHPNRHLHPAVTGERRYVGGFISISPTTIEVRNDGYIEEPVQILYHINLGWPFLAPGTTFETSCNEMLACIDSAIDEDPTTMPTPTKEDVERVWDWNAPSGIQWAKITNSDAAGRGVMSMKLEWDGDQLPHFMQWRNACEALYVQGLEPSTTGLLGRDGDNSHAGSSPNIAPGDSRKFSLNFSFNSSF